jgi:N-acetylmuramoyl-L-alanine amidase
MSVGAHVGGYNTGNIGVCLLGHFNGQLPTTAARESLVRVLAWLAHTCWLDPLGRTHYVNPVNGNTIDVDTISGHRNWAATACPGDMFYPELAAVRSSVAQVPRRKAGGWRPPIPRPPAA